MIEWFLVRQGATTERWGAGSSPATRTMFQLIPIARTEVDFRLLINSVNSALGRSPTATLDEQWHNLAINGGTNNPLSDYLALLKEINKPGSKPFDDAGSLLEHVHLSFLLIATKGVTIKLINESRLSFNTVESRHHDFHLSVVSGTLDRWRTALLNCCDADVEYEVRLFGSKILEFFEKFNIRQFVTSFAKIPMGDGTVRLLERK